MGGSPVFNMAAYVPYIVAIPVVILVAALLLRMLRANLAAAASARWPSAQGRILEARVVVTKRQSGGKIINSNYPYVVYEYTVGRQRFVGNRIAFGSPVGLGAASWVASTIENYRPGAACTVFYDPANPASAVLERRGMANRTLVIVLLVIGALVLLPSLLFGLLLR